MYSDVIVPRLFMKSQGEATSKLSLQLTTAPRRCIVRLTGGCGEMSAVDAQDVYDLFAQAFCEYDGAMLFGGTRMLSRNDRATVVPGITEVPPRLRALCPRMITLGVVPRTQELRLADEGMVVSDEAGSPFFTIVHPQQDIVLVVQVSADAPAVWDAEFQECLRITRDLRDYAAFKSVLVSYNGGSVTEREILAVAQNNWPVILIRGSGRKTDEYANNSDFLHAHPNVKVAEKNADSLRDGLAFFGAVQPRRLSLVSRTA